MVAVFTGLTAGAAWLAVGGEAWRAAVSRLRVSVMEPGAVVAMVAAGVVVVAVVVVSEGGRQAFVSSVMANHS